jgi:hypothetical protein
MRLQLQLQSVYHSRTWPTNGAPEAWPAKPVAISNNGDMSCASRNSLAVMPAWLLHDRPPMITPESPTVDVIPGNIVENGSIKPGAFAASPMQQFTMNGSPIVSSAVTALLGLSGT